MGADGRAATTPWVCEECGHLNTCWCYQCHGCTDVTYDYYYEKDEEDDQQDT